MYTGLGLTSTQETVFAGIEFGIRIAMEAVIKKHAGEPPAKLRPLIVEAGLTAASFAGFDRNDPDVVDRINRLADALLPSTAVPEPPPELGIPKPGWTPILLTAGVILGVYLLTRK